ncbi:hypothetical protein DOTSEDRAFT_121924 [Dothistroma septosporum NZE10]|uniref:Uncharacterized protein n=1 Tax=Dothistroma septosporum (strain NZE10 / CBS 128990) TaxID=675120 RepID=N1Q1P5_DOTSN|nr:hypothetical protein DOTSEDRAFT_121924 [Dothistroma septosporum NZE10]
MLPLYHPQQQSIAPRASSRNLSPPNSLKRHAEHSEMEDLQSLKRLHSGAATEEARHFERRGSIDPISRETRFKHSPPPTESCPGSVHQPRLSSPSFGRYANHRTLPSPSSLAHPTPTAPSLPPLSATQSVNSPATSYPRPSTINAASSSSPTSQHIADLQHQVTLKSLTLQTLQSEYASLLQKLQRERVKSQTIEKKTSAADQEVNDLTSKNEDLTEQVRTLETQLGESETKREHQRQEAAREKEQWGRMLDMSGRLQNKADAEKQRLLEERNYLTQRLAMHENDGSHGRGEQAKRDGTHPGKLHTDCHSARTDRHPDLSQRMTPLTQVSPVDNSGRSNLEKENVTLRARVTALRVTLEGVRRHNEELEASTRGFLEQTGLLWSNVSRALDDDESQSNRTSNFDRAIMAETSAARPRQDPDALRQTEPPQSTISTRQPGLLEIYKDGKRSFANVAEVSRASSAEPRGPGFHVPTTTSSPEELIKALGPVPTTLPPSRLSPPTTSCTPNTPLSQHDKSVERASAFAPTVPPGYMSHHHPAESSPQSYHSSNVEGNEEGVSSSSGTGLRSPETYGTEPEPSSTRPTTSQSVAAPAKPTLGGHHNHSLHGHGKSIDWMPPPPKPEVSYAAYTDTHV